MRGLLEQSVMNQGGVRGEPIELLAQPVSRHQRTVSFQLRLTEHEGKNWNVEIGKGHAQKTPSVRRCPSGHGSKNPGGKILLARYVEGKPRIRFRRQDLA